MADNPTVPLPVNTAIAADDIGGVMYPRTKVSFGADGSATDVSSATPLPSVDAAVKTSVDAVKASADAVKAATDTVKAAVDTTKTAIDSVKTAVDTLKVGTLVSITKADANLASPIRALYVGTAGDVVVQSGGANVTLKNVLAGSWIQGAITQVRTASTAADFVGVV